MAPLQRIWSFLIPRVPQENLGEIFSNLPSSTLENIAAFQPPPGVTANWENPDSHREILILIPTVMMCLMIICIIVRAWVVFWIMRPVILRWSDSEFYLNLLSKAPTTDRLFVVTFTLTVVCKILGKSHQLDYTDL